MTDPISVTGADDIVAISKALKTFNLELRKEFTRGIVAAGKPLIPIVREALAQSYPKSGGLAAKMARSRVRIALRTGTKDPGLSVVIPGIQAKLGEEYGFIRHPVYGRPGQTRREWTWVKQDIDTGAINRAVIANLDKVIPDVEAILEQTATRVLGEFTRGARD